MSDWYQQDVSSVAETLKTDSAAGLSSDDAAARLAEHGPNELVETAARGPWQILWEQLREPMVIMLVVAAAVSMGLGEYKDAGVILAIVVLNAILGVVQDYRAERAMAALKQLTVPHVRAIRDCENVEITALELVPGDVILLETGNLVAADGRLLEAKNLKIQESALTGESEGVAKTSAALSEPNAGIGDRTNMAYMGTVITYGRGRMIVTETGMKTELGRIATMLQTVEAEKTPLQRRLGELGKGLAIAALVIVAVVFFLGIAQDKEWKLMLMTAMSMAVAAVPEGLPAVATVALALGARRMLKRKALIRRLPAVETLGSVTTICSDKTGTLTLNRMTVTNVVTKSGNFKWNEESPTDEREKVVANHPDARLLLSIGTLCSDAIVKPGRAAGVSPSSAPDDQKTSSTEVVGDPTEAALVVAAERGGLDKTVLEDAFPRVEEIPFDADRKRMTTVHQLPAESWLEDGAPRGLLHALAEIADERPDRVIFVKGAVDRLLEVSNRVLEGTNVVEFDAERQTWARQSNDDLAEQGVRVLGMAFRLVGPTEEIPPRVSDMERDLVFVGVAGMIDPPRPEVAEAIARCRTAGIRPMMITGDHPLTARAIAGQLALADGTDVVTGKDLGDMSDEDLAASVRETSVFARVSPEHKLRIVKSLQNQGEVVAMTGDGVNDAPALKRAEIGVAMGITGTDVSKEASEMVLVDDNFATIVNAVEEGRIVYDNIRKFIKYTLTSNAGEIWVMLFPALLAIVASGTFGEIPLPLLPLQILWINLVTDGLPGLALAVEPAERQTMKRPPYPPDENFFSRGMAIDIVWVGLLMGLISFGAVTWVVGEVDWKDAAQVTHWRTMIFTVITLSQMGNAMAIRSQRDSLFTVGMFSNVPMLASVLLTLILQLALLYVPVLQDLFHTVPLSARDLGICVALSTVVFWSVEAQKWWRRKSQPVPA